MHDSIRAQMKQLCESIAAEQNSSRFMELVRQLNDLLRRNETEGEGINAPQQTEP